jgi:hypothetical protein
MIGQRSTFEWVTKRFFVKYSKLFFLRKSRIGFEIFFMAFNFEKNFFPFKTFKNLFEFWLRSVVVALGSVPPGGPKAPQVRALAPQFHPTLPETEPQILLNVLNGKKYFQN